MLDAKPYTTKKIAFYINLLFEIIFDRIEYLNNEKTNISSVFCYSDIKTNINLDDNDYLLLEKALNIQNIY